MPARRLVIPPVATLRGRRYTVHMRSNRAMRKDGDLGECIEPDYPEECPYSIWINPDQDPKELDATWVHELLHAIWPRKIVDMETEEKLVRGLEYRLRDAVARGYLRAED